MNNKTKSALLELWLKDVKWKNEVLLPGDQNYNGNSVTMSLLPNHFTSPKLCFFMDKIEMIISVWPTLGNYKVSAKEDNIKTFWKCEMLSLEI
jgi:hypothetical protein